jgi:hypothetical protein
MRAPMSLAVVLLLLLPAAGASGRIENLETVADLIAYNQEVMVGLSALGEGRIERRVGVITRWELPRINPRPAAILCDTKNFLMEVRMTVSPLRQPAAVVPIAMSLGALAAIGWHVARFGTAPQPDEGAAGHLWQLLIAGQMPVILYYAVKWLPRAPRAALLVLGAQVAAVLAAAAPVFLLGW